jgi:acetyl-CoA C-acetyltransferase
MSRPVFVLGGAQTDFAVNYSRQEIEIDAIMRLALEGALDATSIDAEDIECAHVGNFTGELFSHQGHLGGIFASLHPAFHGLPCSRHEAACASGSVAVLAAAADIECGRYDLACVLGVEQMRNVPGKVAADYLAAAAWYGREGEGATYLWPHMFSSLAEEYDQRYGLDYAHLMAIARKAFDNGKRNPNAHRELRPALRRGPRGNPRLTATHPRMGPHHWHHDDGHQARGLTGRGRLHVSAPQERHRRRPRARRRRPG